MSDHYAWRGSVRALARLSVEHDPGTDPSKLLTLLGTTADRDRLIGGLIDAQESIPLLLGAVRSALDSDPRIADLCAVLSIAAYRHGDSTLSGMASARALRVDRGHRLTNLLVQAVAMGISPAELAEAVVFGMAPS